jgi:hypothetical protein
MERYELSTVKEELTSVGEKISPEAKGVVSGEVMSSVEKI